MFVQNGQNLLFVAMATTSFRGGSESYILCIPDKIHHISKFGGNRRHAISNPLWWLCKETHKFTELEKNVGKSNFAEQFRKLINRNKIIGYTCIIYIMRQTACLVADSYALLFNSTTVVRASDSMTASL